MVRLLTGNPKRINNKEPHIYLQQTIQPPIVMDSIIDFTNYSISAATASWKGGSEHQKDTVWFSDAKRANTVGNFMAVLSDGMEEGQEVSQLIVSTYVNRHATNGSDCLACFLNTANEALKEAKSAGAISDSARADLVAVRITEKGIEWQSVGNSLLYLQRDGEVKQINTAYTLEQKVAGDVECGKTTDEEAQSQAAIEAMSDCRPGDRFIMTSDGFAPLTETAWEELLNAPGIRQASPADTCEMLLMKLKKMNKEEQDNATIIVFDIVKKQEKTVPLPAPTEGEEKLTESNEEEKAIEVQLTGDRSSQQDSVGHWHSNNATLAVVADGAGGHVGGAQASQTAVATLERYWQDKLSAGVSSDEAAEILTQAIQQAHTDIIQNAGGNAALSGKSAIVAVYLHDGQYTCINVGDCRAYVTHQGQWKQLSIDDSLLRILIDKGEVSQQEAKNHPDQNILTQALGTENRIKPHLSHGTFSKEDSFLLCCDGLWNQLPEEHWTLANWEAANAAQYKNVLMVMASKAAIAANGSSDNVSAVWICAAEPNKATFHQPGVPQQTTPINILQSPVAKMVLTAVGLLLITTVLLILCSSPDQPSICNAQNTNEPQSNPKPVKIQSPLDEEVSAPTPPKTDGKLATPTQSGEDVLGNAATMDNDIKHATPTPTSENEPGNTITEQPTGTRAEEPGRTITEVPGGATNVEPNGIIIVNSNPNCEEGSNSDDSLPLEVDYPQQPGTDNNGADKGEPLPGQDKTNLIGNRSYTTTISRVSYISGNRYISHFSYQCGNVPSFHDIRRRTRRQCDASYTPELLENDSIEAIYNHFFRLLLPCKQMPLR